MTASSVSKRFFPIAVAAAILIPLLVLGCDSSKQPTVTEPPPDAPPAPLLPPPPPQPPAAPPPVGDLRKAAAARGFLVGAEVQAAPLQEPGPYRDTVRAEYNLLTPGNAMKFSVIHPRVDRYDFSDADTIVGFAAENGMAVRGHTLVWHNQVPAWVRNQLALSDYSNCSGIAAATRESLRTVLRDHITTVVSRYRGKLLTWDVVSEAFEDGSRPVRRNTIWQCALGPTYIDSAFVWTRRADPDIKLFYHDYGAEGTGVKADSVYNLVTTLRRNGVPIDGVSLQLHGALSSSSARNFSGPTAASVGQNMDRLIGLGVEVQITEMDIKLRNPTTAMRETQGHIFADMLGVCLARPKCTAFVTWGFTDLWTWNNPAYPTAAGWVEPLPFDTSYGHKPAFDSLLARMRTSR